jgi:DNA-binding IclR family transcriptional regulator
MKKTVDLLKALQNPDADPEEVGREFGMAKPTVYKCL